MERWPQASAAKIKEDLHVPVITARLLQIQKIKASRILRKAIIFGCRPTIRARRRQALAINTRL
jgi:hypothetical protein